MPKWRGIKTTQLAKFEDLPKTTTNRFGQKSISLPRIDDKKRWAGYAGITGISRKIASLIPNCHLYVEPFAGTAKVWQELDRQKKKKFYVSVLNDKSKFIYNWLVNEFAGRTLVFNTDFTECITRCDKKDTVFVIDYPWSKSLYSQQYSCFDRESVRDYDKEVLELCENLKGSFIITTNKSNSSMIKSKFDSWLVQSEYVVSGHYPDQMLTTNMRFSKRQREKTGLRKLD